MVTWSPSVSPPHMDWGGVTVNEAEGTPIDPLPRTGHAVGPPKVYWGDTCPMAMSSWGGPIGPGGSHWPQGGTRGLPLAAGGSHVGLHGVPLAAGGSHPGHDLLQCPQPRVDLSQFSLMVVLFTGALGCGELAGGHTLAHTGPIAGRGAQGSPVLGCSPVGLGGFLTARAQH